MGYFHEIRAEIDGVNFPSVSWPRIDKVVQWNFPLSLGPIIGSRLFW